MDLVLKTICDNLVCKRSGSAVRITEVHTGGMHSEFELKCTSANCEVEVKFHNCEKLNCEGKVYEANRRIVYPSRILGLGHSGLQKFCALMDLPPPVSLPTYNKAIQIVNKAVQCEAEKSMQNAAKQEVHATGSHEVMVSGDGTWQKRGHTSKNGVATLIGVRTGKAVDVDILSTFCHTCSKNKATKSRQEFLDWYETHRNTCDINHEGSAGLMESKGMLNLFRRSQAKHGVCYQKYVGDGDSKTFKDVQDDEPYGKDYIVEKIECIGHVQKRMSTRLRNLKKDFRGKKLQDGKPIAGKKRLTDKKIDQIASYYGNAIRGSKTLEEMKMKIWAIFYHYLATDENPEQDYCPLGENSWCKYNAAWAKGEDYSHTSSISEAIMTVLKPVFVALTEDSLLRRCLRGFTQNPNECLNSLIWKIAPKTVFCGRRVVEIAVYDAILTFNDGQKSKLAVLESLQVVPGRFCVMWCNKNDEKRIWSSDKKALESTKEARKAKRLREKDVLEEQAMEEGPSYVAGGF